MGRWVATGHIMISSMQGGKLMALPIVCGHAGNKYEYIGKLRAMEECSARRSQAIPEGLGQIITPLAKEVWQEELSHHPDREFAGLIVRGITEGFRIGYDAERVELRSQEANMVSAREQPGVVTAYLAEEMRQGRIVRAGPVQEARVQGIHCNPFGVIPKRGRPNRWRLIVNLSAPEGHSVNDGISKELSSLAYISVDDIVDRVLAQGRGAMMAKMDIKQAYRNVPVHPQDRLLLGMSWEGQVLVDTALPFGLRSAPLIFTAVADALQWIMEVKGVSYVAHYIDDFITVGAPGSLECEKNSDLMHRVCERVGLPAEPEKDEGPATTIGFLGMEIDSVAQEVRLPQEKLSRMRAELAKWRGRKACKKRELLSLIGVLSHACKAVRSGRSFLRRLIDMSTSTRRLDHFVRLSKEAKSDIEWWFRFSEEWNGVAMMKSVGNAPVEAVLTSDASGSWGCGAYCGADWFMLQWAGPIGESHITAKEMVPIVIAVAVWGEGWAGKKVLARCDNSAVVSTVNRGTSKNQDTMHLARCLAFLTARFNINLVASHIRGVNNTLADALSRDNKSLFLTSHPQANREPSPIPEALLDLLVVTRPDWTSRHWTELWKDIFGTGWPQPPGGPTSRERTGTNSFAGEVGGPHSQQQNNCSASLCPT